MLGADEGYELCMGAGGAELRRLGRKRRAVSRVGGVTPRGEEAVRRELGMALTLVHGARMSERSAREARRAIYGLPWNVLRRPVLVTLTYPSAWERYVASDAVWSAHRHALFERWARRWGERVECFWQKEFQKRGAPHLHMVVSLPERVTAVDYAGLVERTRRLFADYQVFGKYVSGDQWPPVEGEFGWWLRTAWAEIVTGNVPGTSQARRHHVHGVTLRVRFDHGEGEAESRVRMALYLSRDFGKPGQKDAPMSFGPVLKWWGYRGEGFAPEESVVSLSVEVGERLRRRLVRYVALWTLARRGGAAAREYRRKKAAFRGSGASVVGLGADEVMRLLMWSVRAVERGGGDARVVREGGELL